MLKLNEMSDFKGLKEFCITNDLTELKMANLQDSIYFDLRGESKKYNYEVRIYPNNEISYKKREKKIKSVWTDWKKFNI